MTKKVMIFSIQNLNHQNYCNFVVCKNIQQCKNIILFNFMLLNNNDFDIIMIVIKKSENVIS